MSLDKRIHAVWEHLSPQIRAAFFSCFITGLLVHLYAFTNLIPTYDGLSRMFDPQQMTASGRWFLHYASIPNAFTQMPMVIGLLSLLFLGLSAALTVDLLKINSSVLSGTIGAVMAAFPALGYTYLYMFTASAYCIAVFLAVTSLWLLQKGTKLSFLSAVLLLAFSMGIYQAYVTVVIGLSLLLVLKKILASDSTLKGTFLYGLRLILYLACGAILYYLILMLMLRVKGLELLSYLGMDATSSSYPFAQLPQLLFKTYYYFIGFFFLPGFPGAFCTPFFAVLNLAALILAVCFFLHRLVSCQMFREPWRLILSVLVALLLPIGLNFGQILSPFSTPTPIMKYAFVLVYLAVLMLADLNDVMPHAKGKSFQRRFMSCTVIWCAAVLLFCMNTNNILYTAAAQSHRATESYMTRLAGRIEGHPEYEPGMDIAIIGAIPEDQLRSSIPSYSRINHYSIPLSHITTLNKHIYYYLSDWLNFPVKELSEETMISVSESPQFRQMPLYPAPNSIQIIDDCLVVKMQPEYTPKSDFEIAFEHRK